MTVYHMDMNRYRHPGDDPSAKTILQNVQSERFDISIRDSLGYHDAYHKRYNAVLTGSPDAALLTVSDPVLHVKKVVKINSLMLRKEIHEKAASVAGDMHKDLIRKTLVAAGFKPAD